MRRISFFSLLAVLAVAAAGASPAAADVTRSIRGELDAAPGERLGVENLAGTMRILPGGGGRIEVSGTVHAEDGRLADSLQIVEARGQEGQRILRVEYPLDEHSHYKYPVKGNGDGDGGWFGLFGGGNHNTSTKYAGRRVKVSSSRGVTLYADLEIRVPSGDYDIYFRNVVGNLSAADVEGTLHFDSGSGRITLESLRGRISADTGSGTIEAQDIDGRFSGDTGSGDILLTGFSGESVTCDTGSGDVEIRDADAETISGDTGSGAIVLTEIRATSLSADTGSGSISVKGGELRVVNADTGSGAITIVADGVERFLADTGSGDVTLDTDGMSLQSVEVDTGSGDAEIRMGGSVSFYAIADQGSGTIRNGFRDARAIVRDKEVIGYRRGDERVRISFETGSGTLILEPR